MSHLSQTAKVEHSARHTKDNTIKMANLWEEKIGSGKTHSPLPSTVVNSTVTVKPIAPKISENRRRSTTEIVNVFEKLASEDSDLSGPIARRAVSHPTSVAEIEEILGRVMEHFSSIEQDLKELRAKVQSL